MTDDPIEEPEAPPKPSFRARATILLIGGVALLGIALMCIIFVILAANR
jgi:uncharacterized protein involved in exopolysaccharide biosynthesis